MISDTDNSQIKRRVRLYLFLILASVIDIFGNGGALKEYFESVGQRFFSVVSETLYQSNDSFSQKSITVILIDENYMKLHSPSGEWPLPIGTFIDTILQPILDEEPLALFLDFTFPNGPRRLSSKDPFEDGNKSQEKLANEIKNLVSANENAVPIFFASPISPSSTGEELTHKITCVSVDKIESNHFYDTLFERPDSGTNELRSVNTEWTLNQYFYPMITTAVHYGGEDDCDEFLKIEAENKPRYPQTGFLISPAFALFKAMCDRKEKISEKNHTGTEFSKFIEFCEYIDKNLISEVDKSLTKEEKIKAGYSVYQANRDNFPPIEPIWKSGLSKEMEEVYEDSENSNRCLSNHGVWSGFRYIVSLMIPKMEEFIEPKRPCNYINTISAGSIGVEIPKYVRENCKSIEANLDFSKFIKGRVVLLGISIPKSNDFIISPTHGQLPGVYLHAVALETLLQYGKQYHKAPENEWLLDLIIEPIIIAILLPSAWCFLAVVLKKAGKKHPIIPGSLTSILLYMLIILMFSLIWWPFWGYLRLPIGDGFFIICASIIDEIYEGVADKTSTLLISLVCSAIYSLLRFLRVRKL
jgi:CHASE2 domain